MLDKIRQQQKCEAVSVGAYRGIHRCNICGNDMWLSFMELSALARYCLHHRGGRERQETRDKVCPYHRGGSRVKL